MFPKNRTVYCTYHEEAAEILNDTKKIKENLRKEQDIEGAETEELLQKEG